MRTALQRKLFGAAAVLVLVIGGLGVAVLVTAHRRARAAELLQHADVAKAQALDVLRARLSLMEGKAASAASLPVLRAQLGVVDARTLLDGFRTEPWWQRVRESYPIYGVALGDRLEVLEGIPAGELEAAALLKAAREKAQASAVLPHGDAPLLAAASTVEREGLSAALLVAKPLDVSLLDEMATRVHGAVLVTDGKSTLLAVGPAAERSNLAAARGAETAGVQQGDGWVAAAAPLGAGLWLWVHAHAPAGGGPPLDVIVLGLLAAATAALLLLLALRKDDPAQVAFAGDDAPTQALQHPGAQRPARTGATGGGATDPTLSGAQLKAGRRGAGPASASNPNARTGASSPARSGASNPNARTGTSNPNARSGAAATSLDALVEGPQRFGRYWLIDRLGEGGMAEVFLAVAFGAENFRRTFVLKRLRSDAVRTEALVHMFIDEAKLASSLIHGNIIPVFDFGKVGDEYFIAQEYILGRDLRRVTNRALERDQAPLPERFAVFAMRETLRALDYAHSATGEGGRPLNLVHRDVSPNNILISARGEVKLFDFGIAKADEGRLTQTQTGVVKGNIRFMSEEQARGEHVDQRADLASLGLVFYFALTGENLYEGETGYALLMQAAQGLTDETGAKIDKLPQPLAAILRRAIAPREERFQSAAEFEQALSSLPAATGSELWREMERLFGPDLKVEEARLANITLLPDDDGGTIAWGTPPGEEPPTSENQQG